MQPGPFLQERECILCHKRPLLFGLLLISRRIKVTTGREKCEGLTELFMRPSSTRTAHLVLEAVTCKRQKKLSDTRHLSVHLLRCVAVWTNSSTVQRSRRTGSCWLLLTLQWVQAAIRKLTRLSLRFWLLVIAKETSKIVRNVRKMKPPPQGNLFSTKSPPKKRTR